MCRVRRVGIGVGELRGRKRWRFLRLSLGSGEKLEVGFERKKEEADEARRI